MKVLKTAACVALFVVVSISSANFAVASASAATDGRRYARADTRTVYFCSEMDPTSARFAVPYTYCVEILADHGEWYLARYAADDGFYKAQTGYCKKEGLTEVEQPPENIYLSFPVAATLRADVPRDDSMPGLEITVEAAYYGVYYKGAAAYSCVLYDNSFWYIPGANEDYPLNEIPAEPTFSQSEPQNDGGNSKLITAIIITAIALCAVIALIFTGKQKGSKKQIK